MSPVPIRSLVPMAHVASVPIAAEFYEKLGFEARNSFTPPGAAEPSWVSLVAGDAELMLTRADRPVPRDEQGVLFYLYCGDVARMHAELTARGIAVGEIERPFYNPGGEFRLTDPDGYVIFITHT